MLSVEDALLQILQTVVPFEATAIPLGDALGLSLAGDIVSDTDSPPFDKALMDGYAVRSAEFANGNTATLRVIEEITAGNVPTKSIGPGEASRIMTGAPMPVGADAVVKIEETQFDEANRTVAIETAGVSPGTNMMPRGTTMRAGETVLSAGRLLRPQEIGALAEMGVANVAARRKPTVAILATGNELVPVDQKPGPGQIRNSNEAMIVAQVQRAGGMAAPLGIARDNRPDLSAKIAAGLQNDVLLLSGGVSAGKLDLVPSELEAAGVQAVFHKVHIKPGKPIWFGVRSATADSRNPCYVFGLPGNPVSSMVCFEIFVRTALRQLMGQAEPRPQTVAARILHDHTFRGDRPTYFPCQLEWTESGPAATIGTWHGSADLRSTCDSNALAVFEPGDKQFTAGDRVDVLPW